MASRVKSGKSGDLDGYQVPRRSGRGRKPKASDNFVYLIESPRKTRGKNAGRTHPKPTGSRHNEQVQRNRDNIRHQATIESDADYECESDEYESITC